MGFDQFNALLKAKTQLGDEDDVDWQKTPATAGALVAGGYYDLFEGSGDPAAGAYPTGSNAFKLATGNNGSPQIGGVSTPGFISFANVGATKTKHLLWAEAVTDQSNGQGDVILLDVLGAYCDLNLATAGAIATGTGVGVADITRYSTGKRVFMYLVSQVTFTGTPPTVTIAYTDENLASQSTSALTLITGCVKGRVATAAFRVPLAAGNRGVVAVRSVTHAGGAAPTGKYAIVLARKLGSIKIDSGLTRAEKSFSDPRGSFLFPRVLDNAALNLIYRPSSTPTTPTLFGNYAFADGAV
jgi:hypothetical protein